MLRSLLLFFLLFFFVLVQANAQSEKHAKLNVRLDKTSDYKVGEEVVVWLELVPDPSWHIYSLKETGAYKPTVITFSDECRDIKVVGEPSELGEMVTEYDEIMGGDLIYFKGNVFFTQSVRITGKHPKIVGNIEYQACSGERCVLPIWDFKIEVHAK